MTTVPQNIYVLAKKAALKNGVDESLVLAVIKCESGFNENAVSDKGACGLMQLMPRTFDYICNINGVCDGDIFDSYSNVFAGTAYLKYLFSKFNGLDEVLCAYNAGEGTVFKWLENEKYSLDKKTLLIIPYPETRDYLFKVKNYYYFYKGLQK